MDKKSKITIIAICILAFLSVALTFYNTVILGNFRVDEIDVTSMEQEI